MAQCCSLLLIALAASSVLFETLRQRTQATFTSTQNAVQPTLRPTETWLIINRSRPHFHALWVSRNDMTDFTIRNRLAHLDSNRTPYLRAPLPTRGVRVRLGPYRKAASLRALPNCLISTHWGVVSLDFLCNDEMNTNSSAVHRNLIRRSIWAAAEPPPRKAMLRHPQNATGTHGSCRVVATAEFFECATPLFRLLFT